MDKENLKRLIERKKFFELWYDRCGPICKLQLNAINKELAKYK